MHSKTIIDPALPLKLTRLLVAGSAIGEFRKASAARSQRSLTLASGGNSLFDDTQNASRFTASIEADAAAVPEPATWAMMIGSTVRRQRRRFA